MSYVCRHNVGLDFHCFTCEKEVANYIDEILADDEIDDDNYDSLEEAEIQAYEEW